MQVINKKIIVIFICLSIFIFSMFKLFNKQDIELDDVRLDMNNHKDNLAIYLKEYDEEGNSSYLESEENIFPKSGYIFNKELSGCIDTYGNNVKDILNYEEGIGITINTNKTLYCYVYFDETKGHSLSKKLDVNNEFISEEIVGDMYRYQGTDNVNNWLCFGTNDKNECLNDYDKYMYRIIGINNEGEMKLIKETFVKEGDINYFTWNKQCGTNCPEWNESLLFKRLNGISNGSIPGYGNSDDNADTNIFINSSNYEYMKEKNLWYEKIISYNWMYGDVDVNDVKSYDGDILFAIETGLTTTSRYELINGEYIKNEDYKWSNSKAIDAKIGLMYIHDYYYAYKGGKPGNKENAGKSWLNSSKDYCGSQKCNKNGEYLIDRQGLNNPEGVWLYWSYCIEPGMWWASYSSGRKEGIRPVFYLTDEIKIFDGDGSQNNPFLIQI